MGCEKIPINIWFSVHRYHCIRNNDSILSNHPLAPELGVRCGKCNGTLRQWTSYRKKYLEENSSFICEHFFHSSSPLDPRRRYKKKEISNNDLNRFNCFKCDYDVCDKCVNRIKLSHV